MAISPLGSLPSLAGIPQVQPFNPLEALLGGFQQGVALRQLPQQLANDQLNQQLQQALLQAKVNSLPLEAQKQQLALQQLQAQLDPNYAAKQQAAEIQFAVQKARALGQVERELSGPAQPKTFTLSPGQKVFDIQGNEIASLPSTEKESRPIVVAPGSTVIDSQGKEVFRNVSASEGTGAQPVFDPSGNLLGYSLPKNFKSTQDLQPESKIPKQTAVDVTFSTNIDSFKRHAQQLKEVVTKFGGYEGGVPLLSNPDATAALEALPYAMAIEYAKLKDPDSVAREGEVAAAKKYLIPIGSTTRNSVTLAAINRQITDIEELRKSRARAKGGTDLGESNVSQDPLGLFK